VDDAYFGFSIMGNSPSTDRGQQWLTQVLSLSGIAAPVRAEIRESLREHSCWLEIDATTLSEAQQQSLIGEKGQTIDALQYLANVVLNHDLPESEKGAYTIDLAGYREARHVELEKLAESAITQLQSGQTEAEIPHLSAAERRQLHHWIEQSGEYSTFSRGQDADRRLVVCLPQNLPQSE
jgi:spoIIIJ-associated protein